MTATKDYFVYQDYKERRSLLHPTSVTEHSRGGVKREEGKFLSKIVPPSTLAPKKVQTHKESSCLRQLQFLPLLKNVLVTTEDSSWFQKYHTKDLINFGENFQSTRKFLKNLQTHPT